MRPQTSAQWPLSFTTGLRLLVLLSAASAHPAAAEDMTAWPALPTSGFVAGRSATIDDIVAGDALFVLGDGETPSGEAVAIDIPQYAIFRSDEETVAVIITQAEQDMGPAIAAAVTFDGRQLVGHLQQFTLLGTEPSDEMMRAFPHVPSPAISTPTQGDTP